LYKHKRETGGAEGGGDVVEAENDAGSSPELGVAGGELEVENKNLATEANGGESGTEADDLKEVEALRTLLAQAATELSAMKKLGIGPIGAGVAGGGNVRSAIESAILAGKWSQGVALG
jgi:hypothetical protein